MLGVMDRSGLSTDEAARRLLAEGPNEVPARARVTVPSSIIRQLRDPLVVVLLVACALTVATGDFADTAVIALVVAVNTSVGVIQEHRADQAVTALAQLITPSVRVRRDGAERSISSAEIVPGDVVLLEEGDIVPADGELLEAVSLLVDESALTGESVAAGRRGPHGDRSGDPLSSGSVIVKGRAELAVTATGPRSAMGRIASQVETGGRPTPFERRLAQLGGIIAIVAVVLSILVLVLGLVRGQPLELMLVTAVSLAVAAVPESLPAVVSLSLALGAARMAARNAIVRRLAAVETLGSITVLATDKTGTLTQGRMAVRETWTPARGSGEREEGRIALVRAAVLCNDARLVPAEGPEDLPTGLGDPTEVALLVEAARTGVLRSDLERQWARVDEEPFDSATAMMTTVHRRPDHDHLLVVTKGSPEALFAREQIQRHPVWLEAQQQADRLGALGYRVLAFTSAEVDEGADWRLASHELLGLVALEDPAKPAARDTVLACHRAGIRTVLITGDHPTTARAMAVRVGILDDRAEDGADDEAVVTGSQLRAGEIDDLTGPRVFARTTPDQKLDIVAAWLRRGAVVAMTGDGVNDGPALRHADIGVAMGHRGTEVARQASDLVLADDELATVVTAVEEGRRVYSNIRRFLFFGLSGGTAEILVMLAGPFVGLALPLLPAQILWINLLTHGLTGVALGAEPVEPGTMSRPPRPPEQTVLGGGLWPRILLAGALIATVSLALGVWAEGQGRAWQSLVFLSLVSLQLGVALGLRAATWTTANAFLPLAALGSLVLALAGVYLPVLNRLLGTVPLNAAEAALGLATIVVGWVITRTTVLLMGARRCAS